MKLLPSFLTLFLFTTYTNGEPPDSVQPLQWYNDKGVLASYCTAFAYRLPRDPRTHWLTAGHCASDDTRDYRVIGQIVNVEALDSAHDLASLIGLDKDVKAPPLTIARKLNNNVGDVITVLGYPFGWDVIVQTKGWLAGVFIAPDTNRLYTLYNVPSAPGNSGAPIFNARHEVIGVMQIDFCPDIANSFCPLTGGAPLLSLQNFIASIQ